MLKLSYWIDELSKWAGLLGAITVFVLALLIAYDASMRYIFNEGSVALQELEWHLFDIIFLLGLSYALKHNKHVRVDIFYAKMSAKSREIVQIITMIFFIIPLSLLVVWFSWDFVLQSFMQGEESANPGGLCCRYIIKSFVIVSFILLMLQAVSETIKSCYKIKRNI